MRSRRSIRVPSALALLSAAALATGCGDPPRRTPVGGGGTDAGTGAVGGAPTAPPTNASPSGAGAAQQGEPIRFEGRVELVGDLAQARPPAAVFVNLKQRGGEGAGFPILSRRFDLTDPGVEMSADGALVVPFELTGADLMGATGELNSAQLPPSYDLEAMYDPTGGLSDPDAYVRRRLAVEEHDLDGLVIRIGA